MRVYPPDLYTNLFSSKTLDTFLFSRIPCPTRPLYVLHYVVMIFVLRNMKAIMKSVDIQDHYYQDACASCRDLQFHVSWFQFEGSIPFLDRGYGSQLCFSFDTVSRRIGCLLSFANAIFSLHQQKPK